MSQARQMPPGPRRRAVAATLHAERTVDLIAGITGTTIHIPNRILVKDKRVPGSLDLHGRPELSELTNVLDQRYKMLSDLQDEYQGSPIGDQIGETLNDLERIYQPAYTEGYNNTPKRSGERRHDDILSAEQAIARAADAPEAPAEPLKIEPRSTPNSPTAANYIQIEMLLEGMLTYYDVDRLALIAEIQANQKIYPVTLSSPAARSNFAPRIESLGNAFPPALFELRGNTIIITKMEIQPNSKQDSDDVWFYQRQTRHHLPTFKRKGPALDVDLYARNKRQLRDVMKAPWAHESIIVQSTAREMAGISGHDSSIKSSSITIIPRYTDLREQANTTPRHGIERQPAAPALQWMEPEDYNINKALAAVKYKLEKGVPFPFVYQAINDQYIEVTLGYPSRSEKIYTEPHFDSWYHKTYHIRQDALAKGATGVRKRIKEIIKQHTNKI